MSIENFTGEPEVEGPNSAPTGSHYDICNDNYVGEAPDIPVPEWLRVEAERMAQGRADAMVSPNGPRDIWSEPSPVARHTGYGERDPDWQAYRRMRIENELGES